VPADRYHVLHGRLLTARPPFDACATFFVATLARHGPVQKAGEQPDQRKDHNHDQGDELPATPVTDDEVQDEGGEGRQAGEHENQQRSCQQGGCRRPDCACRHETDRHADSDRERKKRPWIAQCACRLRDVERSRRDRQQQQPDGIRTIHRRHEQRTDEAESAGDEQQKHDDPERRHVVRDRQPVTGIRAERREAQGRGHQEREGDDRPYLLDREREPLDGIACARPLECVHQHAPAHPGERAQSTPHGARSSPDRRQRACGRRRA
jgi:hypothetical protein